MFSCSKHVTESAAACTHGRCRRELRCGWVCCRLPTSPLPLGRLLSFLGTKSPVWYGRRFCVRSTWGRHSSMVATNSTQARPTDSSAPRHRSAQVRALDRTLPSPLQPPLAHRGAFGNQISAERRTPTHRRSSAQWRGCACTPASRAAAVYQRALKANIKVDRGFGGYAQSRCKTAGGHEHEHLSISIHSLCRRPSTRQHEHSGQAAAARPRRAAHSAARCSGTTVAGASHARGSMRRGTGSSRPPTCAGLSER